MKSDFCVSMTMRGRALAIFSQSYRFHNCWRILQRNNVGLLCGGFVNLKQEPQCVNIIQNVNSKCMSLANLPKPETNIQRFLKYLVKVYTNKDHSEFQSFLENYAVKELMNERIKILKNIKSLKELGEDDKEMKKLVDEEKLTNENRLQQIDDELINLVIESLEGDNFDDIILELTAGVGGKESTLFLKELLEMYMHHIKYLGYSFDIIEVDNCLQGGVRHASISVSGRGSFEKLRHEAGVHRVQRVPVTENSGRIHTSVVSVAVLPQPNEIQVEINPKDLKIDTMRASGAGGQHVNTTNSAVRITHLPSGLVVHCQVDKSQIKNRKLALGKIRAKLYERKLSSQLKNTTDMRKQQMGMGERHEKIRTYNYNQDRITDHRLSDGTLHNLENFLQGGLSLDNLHSKLNDELRYNLLMEVVNSVK